MIIAKIILLTILTFIFIAIVPTCMGLLLSGESLDDSDDDITFIYTWLVCMVMFVVVVVLWATAPCPFAIK